MPYLEESLAAELHHPAASFQVAVITEHTPGIEPDLRTVGQHILALVVGRSHDIGLHFRLQVIFHDDVVCPDREQQYGGRSSYDAPNAAHAEPLVAAHRLVEPFEFALPARMLFDMESVPIRFQFPLLLVARGRIAQPAREALLHLPGHIVAEEGLNNVFYSIYRHNNLSRFIDKTVWAYDTHA